MRCSVIESSLVFQSEAASHPVGMRIWSRCGACWREPARRTSYKTGTQFCQTECSAGISTGKRYENQIVQNCQGELLSFLLFCQSHACTMMAFSNQ